MSYNFNVVINTKNFEVGVDEEAQYGYFEHNELGDECGGGLWFSGKTLRDYDGVCGLPREVEKALKDAGFDMSEVEDDD